MTEQPPVIDYRQPPDDDARRKRAAVVRFGVGALVGVLIGGLGFLVAMNMRDYDGLVVLFIFTPAAGIILGLCLLPARRTRMVGAGLLTLHGLAGLMIGSMCLR